MIFVYPRCTSSFPFVIILASLLQAVSIYKGAISFVFSFASELWALFFFPISLLVSVWVVLALCSCRLRVKWKWLIKKGDGRVLNATDKSNMPPYVKQISTKARVFNPFNNWQLIHLLSLKAHDFGSDYGKWLFFEWRARRIRTEVIYDLLT